MDTIFSNQVYSDLEKRINLYLQYRTGSLENILRDIREASLYGKIESYEEIHLMDMLELKKAEDIDDGVIEMHDKTTGGITPVFEKEEKYDMSYLDDYEEKMEEEESGFLSFLK